MDAGIRAIGFVLPFALHQLYRRLQPGDRTELRPQGISESEHLTSGSLLDEEDEEPDFGLPGPTCPVVEGSSIQRYVRELSYSGDEVIGAHVLALLLGPAVLRRVFFFLAGCL